MTVSIESLFSTFDVQAVTFFWLLFLSTVQARKEWGDTLKIFFFLIWSFCHQEFFLHPCYVSLMADLSDSVLLPLKQLPVNPHFSHGKCWIRDLVPVSVLEGCKSISSQVLLNPSQYGFCLQFPLTWVSGLSDLLCAPGAFCLDQTSAQKLSLLFPI